MKEIILSVVLFIVTMLALFGCATAPGPYEPYVAAPYVYGYHPTPVVFFYEGD